MRNKLQILIFLTSSILFAQIPQELSKPSKRIEKFDTYTGAIYTHKKYQQATIIDEKSGTFDAKLKYNIYTDAIEFEKGSKLYELPKSLTTHVRIQDDYYYYCNFKTNLGVRKQGYFVLIDLNESYRIYKKYDLDITDPKGMDPMTGSAITGKIKVKKTLYLEENGKLTPLPLNKKELLVTFSDKKDILKNYIKKEKLKVKKEEDMVKVVAKYNTLKSTETNQSRSLLSNRVQNN